MSPSVFCPDQDGEPLEAETLCLPAVAASVPFARRMVARCLSAWDLDDLLFPCTQVVAELAANSVAEADAERTPKPQDRGSKTFTVHLARTFSHLFVKVGDASPDPPKPRDATEQDENGRGLVLVEALADHWGWHLDGPEGKVVYAAWILPGTSATARPVEVRW
ncbi:ATP-binding protein [Actinocorallia libanotica]|uniref:Histidine kinase/HSP90-like ATPase domain-containing protein n=1 Tax=Actinocorallia libanotica TaxID=46162 RepID=A0ABN1RFF4_9ACTN